MQHDTPRGAKRQSTLRRKLVLLVVCSVGLAAAPIAGVSAWRDGARDVGLETARLNAAALVVASLASQPAADNDRMGAFRALRAIARMNDVQYGRIESVNGTLLVETGTGARLSSDVRAAGKADASLWTGLFSRTSEVSAPIHADGKIVGRVLLLGQTQAMVTRFLSSLAISLGVALLAIMAGLAIAWRLQERIAGPLVALTRAMQRVQDSHDYEQAVTVQADGETASLVRGFNRMLGEIRARDARIAAQMAGLESEVASRTAELVVARDAAQSANHAKSDFLATMSHEIRTPMNGVMVMAEMLAAGQLPPRERRFAEVIAKSGASLLAIINDILDFSKIEAGKLELETVALDPGEIADDVLSLFWERAASKGLDLAACVDPATPHAVAGDPVRLRQVVSNLVNNAIKFTERGGVMVEIAPDAPGGVRFAVRDTGIGIAQDKLGSVFGAFSQADQSTTRRFGGTGLGLAICKTLVNAMGGAFEVTSTVGEGSCFAFSVPLKTLEAAAPWPRADAPATVGLALSGVQTCASLTTYFTRAGYTVGGDGPYAVAVVDGAAADRVQAQTILCLSPYGDSRPQALLRAGKVAAVLAQPVRRRDVAELLQRIASGAPLETADTVEETAAAALPVYAGARVLVADDSAVNREVAQEALRRFGIDATLVDDGRQAVEAQAQPFDLILMDGSMPVLDGFAAARAIRASEAEKGLQPVPIVALTAHVVGSGADAWRAAGMNGVLHKPFTLKALGEILARHLTAAEPTVDNTPPVQAPTRENTAALSADPLFDAATVEQLQSFALSGQGAFVARVQRLYLDNAPNCIVALKAAQDAQGAASAVHALKSMSGNIGAAAVAKACAALERRARDGAMPEGHEIAALDDVLRRTLAALGGEAAPDDAAQLMADLERAIAGDRLRLVYHAQFDAGTRAVVGCEALVRWDHPQRGVISPALFIPLAERHGVIGKLTHWVFDRMMAEMADATFPVAVNASAVDFAQGWFVADVEALLEKHRFAPQRLEVEITETALLEQQQTVKANMERLRARGVKIALDDFGTGYSSLQHLRRFPFDKLKIDREFITDCTAEVQSATVIHAVASIGRALGMKVVAEGVESENNARFLKIAGVHALQGFLFGAPVPRAEMLELAAPPAVLSA